MNTEVLKLLVRLGLIEALQSYFEGDDYYYTEDENAEDDFFKEDINDNNEE